MSLQAFLSFTLPCLLPAIAYLFWGGDDQQRGWGWLGLILLVSLSVVAWQVNRLMQRGLLRRFQNQALIEHLQNCLLYTSDAADDTPCVDLGGRRIIKKKKR